MPADKRTEVRCEPRKNTRYSAVTSHEPEPCSYLQPIVTRRRCFTLGDLLDKPWSQVSSLASPPRYVPLFFVAHRVQLSRCSSISIESSQLTLSRFPLINFYARKSPWEHALDETQTHESDLDRHADHLSSRRGRRHKTMYFIDSA